MVLELWLQSKEGRKRDISRINLLAGHQSKLNDIKFCIKETNPDIDQTLEIYNNILHQQVCLYNQGGSVQQQELVSPQPSSKCHQDPHQGVYKER